MITTEHDEALVERVALAMFNERCADFGGAHVGGIPMSHNPPRWADKARAVIYPPAPPKTRLQVARELLSAEASKALMPPFLDDGPSMRAILAALALPAMED